MSGIVEAEVFCRVRMAPELYLGLTSYELDVPGYRTVSVRQFLSIRQIAADIPQPDSAENGHEPGKGTAVFVPEDLHIYTDGPKPVWIDLDAVWRGLVGESGPERPAPVCGLSMDGLLVAEMPLAIRMSPTLWLGLVTYTLNVYGLRQIAVQHFVSDAHTRKRESGEVEPPF